MKFSFCHLVVATAFAAVTAISFAPVPAPAAENAATAEPGFNPDTGQINPGFDKQLPSSGYSRKIPTPAEARAAKFMKPASEPAPAAAPPSTTGAATAAAPAAGPIGATGQTMPAALSHRNDVLDRVPIMAQPMPLSDEQRRQIYQAVQADKAPVATDADKLAPAGQLSTRQALNEMHALPQAVQSIAPIKGLKYIKSKNKVFLVEPATRVVFEEISS